MAAVGCSGSSPTAPSAVIAGVAAPSAEIPVLDPPSSAPAEPAPAPAEPEPPAPEPTEPEPPTPDPEDPEPPAPVPEDPEPPAPDPEDPEPPAPDPEDPEPPAPEPEDPEPPAPEPEDPEPPAPDPEPEPPPTPNGLSIEFAPSVSNTEIRLTWNPVPEATYTVELGDAPGRRNFGRFNVDASSFAFGDLPPGDVFARVRARNGSATSPPSTEVSEWFFDMKDYVEALFLGTGRLTPTDGNHGCSATGWVRGFGRGTSVPLSVSTTVSSGKEAAIHGVANQVSQATAGALQVVVRQTTDPNPIPGENEATSTTHPSPASEGCGGNGGCTIHVFVSNASPGRFYSSRAVQPANQTPEAYARRQPHRWSGAVAHERRARRVQR